MARAINPHRMPLDAHPQWKGDAASDHAKRERLRRRVPAADACERCGARAADGAKVERHHRDGDPGNNAPENVAHLCTMCHMTVDGRRARFAERMRQLPQSQPQPPKPCSNCGAPSKPLTLGRCERCRGYFRRHGRERPIAALNDSPGTGGQ